MSNYMYLEYKYDGEQFIYEAKDLFVKKKNVGDGDGVDYMKMLNGCFTLLKVVKNVKP